MIFEKDETIYFEQHVLKHPVTSAHSVQIHLIHVAELVHIMHSSVLPHVWEDVRPNTYFSNRNRTVCARGARRRSHSFMGSTLAPCALMYVRRIRALCSTTSISFSIPCLPPWLSQ